MSSTIEETTTTFTSEPHTPPLPSHKRKLEVSTDDEQTNNYKAIRLDLNVAVNDAEGDREGEGDKESDTILVNEYNEASKPFLKTKSLLETEELVRQLEEEERRIQEEQDTKDRSLALNLQPKQCPLCLEDTDIDFMHTLLKCNHEVCRECANKYVTGKIAERSFPIRVCTRHFSTKSPPAHSTGLHELYPCKCEKCPVYPCKQELVDTDLELLLDKITYEMYSNNSLAAVVEKDPTLFSCCPTPDCTYVFFKAQSDSSDFGCPLCKKRYCLSCKVDYHSGSTCEQYQAWSLENGTADDLFTDFVVGHKFKKCPGCQRWVEKDEGCDHMTCRCGYEFCYRCGGKYGRCNCTGEEDDEDEDRYDEDEY